MKATPLSTISPQIPISQRIRLGQGPSTADQTRPDSGSSESGRNGRSQAGNSEERSLPNSPRPPALDPSRSGTERSGSSRQTPGSGEQTTEPGGSEQTRLGLDRLSSDQRRQIQKLKRIDAKVRAHEQAHLAAAGQYAQGGPRYEYVEGPDGRRYAVAGEVNLDTGEEESPEETVRKMKQVRAAALAPAQPSPQDRSVASKASRELSEARRKLQKQETREQNPASGASFGRGNDLSESPNETSEPGESGQHRASAGNSSGPSVRPGTGPGLEHPSDIGISVDEDVSERIGDGVDENSSSEGVLSEPLREQFLEGTRSGEGFPVGGQLDLRV